MRQTRYLWLLALASCASSMASTEMLSEAEANQEARLTLSGGRVISVSSPIDFRALPARARATSEAIQPEGTLIFCAQERGPHGDGYRVEKHYEEPFPHMRSVLVDVNGSVLERSHTLRLVDVPQHVLATALSLGPKVKSAEIVSGPIAEELWRVVIEDRRGRVLVASISLEGTLWATARRNLARVDS